MTNVSKPKDTYVYLNAFTYLLTYHWCIELKPYHMVCRIFPTKIAQNDTCPAASACAFAILCTLVQFYCFAVIILYNTQASIAYMSVEQIYQFSRLAAAALCDIVVRGYADRHVASESSVFVGCILPLGFFCQIFLANNSGNILFFWLLIPATHTNIAGCYRRFRSGKYERESIALLSLL
jgi:hypothetical protein